MSALHIVHAFACVVLTLKPNPPPQLIYLLYSLHREGTTKRGVSLPGTMEAKGTVKEPMKSSWFGPQSLSLTVNLIRARSGKCTRNWKVSFQTGLKPWRYRCIEEGRRNEVTLLPPPYLPPFPPPSLSLPPSLPLPPPPTHPLPPSLPLCPSLPPSLSAPPSLPPPPTHSLTHRYRSQSWT